MLNEEQENDYLAQLGEIEERVTSRWAELRARQTKIKDRLTRRCKALLKGF